MRNLVKHRGVLCRSGVFSSRRLLSISWQRLTILDRSKLLLGNAVLMVFYYYSISIRNVSCKPQEYRLFQSQGIDTIQASASFHVSTTRHPLCTSHRCNQFRHLRLSNSSDCILQSSTIQDISLFIPCSFNNVPKFRTKLCQTSHWSKNVSWPNRWVDIWSLLRPAYPRILPSVCLCTNPHCEEHFESNSSVSFPPPPDNQHRKLIAMHPSTILTTLVVVFVSLTAALPATYSSDQGARVAAEIERRSILVRQAQSSSEGSAQTDTNGMVKPVCVSSSSRGSVVRWKDGCKLTSSLVVEDMCWWSIIPMLMLCSNRVHEHPDGFLSFFIE